MTWLTRTPADLRRIGLVAITVGLAAIVLAVVAYRGNVKTLAGDRRDVAGLERQLDSARAALRAATDSGAAARLREEIRTREYGLSRRAFHIPPREEAVRTWWRPTGTGGLASVLGIILLALGVIAVRSGRRGG